MERNSSDSGLDITVVGDPHITPKSLEKGIALFEMVEHLGNEVIWLGDLLDTKEVVRGSCLNAFYDYFSKSKLQHTVLVGNHDWFNLDCKDHSLKPLSALSNVHIVDKAQRYPDQDVYCLPYIHDKAALKKELDKIPTDSVIFGHLEVAGFDFGNGHLCEDPALTYEDLSVFRAVISGHFHKYQRKDKFIYLGTPFSHSFGETDQEKYLGVYNTKTNEMELLRTPFERHVTLKLPLNKYDHKDILASFLRSNQANVVRVQLFGTDHEINTFDKSEFSNYKIKYDHKPSDSVETGVSLDESLNNKNQFITWSKDIKQMDEATMNLGLSILEQLGVK